MGFDKGHTDVGLCVNQREQLVGNSFHVEVLMRLLRDLPWEQQEVPEGTSTVIVVDWGSLAAGNLVELFFKSLPPPAGTFVFLFDLPAGGASDSPGRGEFRLTQGELGPQAWRLRTSPPLAALPTLPSTWKEQCGATGGRWPPVDFLTTQEKPGAVLHRWSDLALRVSVRGWLPVRWGMNVTAEDYRFCFPEDQEVARLTARDHKPQGEWPRWTAVADS